MTGLKRVSQLGTVLATGLCRVRVNSILHAGSPSVRLPFNLRVNHMIKPDTTAYQFGPFILDTVERRLLRDGRPVALTAKLFDILLLLVRNSGKVVTKESLMKEIWSDSFVEENNLTVSISSLRKTLGERYRQREYIETVTKHGYRFTARVEPVQDSNGARHNGAGPHGLVDEPAKALAVLPFLNISRSPDLEFLSDGLTESIIINMSRLRRLRVMARNTVFRYKGREPDARQVGRDLNVQTVLTGRLREFNGQMLLAVEMVNVSDGSQIWGETYNRPLSDIFRVQEEIASELSEKLRMELSSEDRKRLTDHQPQSFKTYYLYLKGRYFWNKRTLQDIERAIKCFEECLLLEPDYALARAGLADCYLSLIFLNALPLNDSIPLVRREAVTALALNETIAEAHASLGCVEMLALNWEGADRGLRRAIELNPNNALARSRYSFYLMARGQVEEALAQMEWALRNDPLSAHMHANVARIHYYARQYDRAIEECRQALEIEPHCAPVHGLLSLIHERHGMYEEAIAEMQRALDLLGNDPEAMGLLGYLYALSGKRREARAVLNKLIKMSEQKYASPVFIAWIYVGLHEMEKAFEYLERAYEERSYMPILNITPLFDRLRPDPRYHDLLRRCGFPPEEFPAT
jgi:TolB-like protein/Flp pilus assembly protein TadD